MKKKRKNEFACHVLMLFFDFRLPSNVKKVFHPIICCALSADLTAFAFGYLSKLGLDPVLGMLEDNCLISVLLYKLCQLWLLTSTRNINLSSK